MNTEDLRADLLMQADHEAMCLFSGVAQPSAVTTAAIREVLTFGSVGELIRPLAGAGASNLLCLMVDKGLMEALFGAGTSLADPFASAYSLYDSMKCPLNGEAPEAIEAMAYAISLRVITAHGMEEFRRYSMTERVQADLIENLGSADMLSNSAVAFGFQLVSLCSSFLEASRFGLLIGRSLPRVLSQSDHDQVGANLLLLESKMRTVTEGLRMGLIDKVRGISSLMDDRHAIALADLLLNGRDGLCKLRSATISHYGGEGEDSSLSAVVKLCREACIDLGKEDNVTLLRNVVERVPADALSRMVAGAAEAKFLDALGFDLQALDVQLMPDAGATARAFQELDL